MVNRIKSLCALAVLGAFSVPALAETLPPPPAPVVGSAYLDEMARMDAELAVLRKRQEVRQAQEAITGASGTAKMPKVLATYMSEGRLVAEIMYDHGLVTRVRGGETIPGDLLVVSVEPKGVTVRAGSTKTVLDYAVRNAVAAPVEPVMPPAPMAAPAAR